LQPEKRKGKNKPQLHHATKEVAFELKLTGLQLASMHYQYYLFF
jgi:hypothetical protein